MKTFVWISTGLMLIELLSFSSISLAEEGKWTKKVDMPTARFGFSSGVVNGEIYAIGGSRLALVGNPSLSTVEAYDSGHAGEGEEGQSVEAKGKLATSWGKMKK